MGNKMQRYHKDDRAMRLIYKLFYPNFVHAYGHYNLRRFYAEHI